MHKVSVIIPTLNAAASLGGLLAALKAQSVASEIVIIDSASSDDTLQIAQAYGARIIQIERSCFTHGGTRTAAGKMANGEILVYLTQDALPMDAWAVEALIAPFTADDRIGATYGRQLSGPDASPFAAHLRAFNYPAQDCVKSLEDRARLGLKTAFLSNSFAAYRRSALETVGWFKEGLMMGEDIQVGARLLLSGYRIAYVAQARVRHAHNYTLAQEFKRYMQIGAFHQAEAWMLRMFGGSEGEGLRYVRSELQYLSRQRQSHLIPLSLVRNALKYVGYRWGRLCAGR
jgi:rhamnosyltransferase